MDHLSIALSGLRSAWQDVCGGPINLVPEPDSQLSGSTVSVPVTHEGVTYGWLEAQPSADRLEVARSLLRAWADLLGIMAGDREAADGLTRELIVAWDRLSFLHQVAQLMRTMTDPWELSAESLRLAAATIEAEDAFVAQLRDTLDFRWLGSSHDQDETSQIIAVLQGADGVLVHNGASACLTAFPGVFGLRSFMGQQLKVTAGPPSFIGLVNQTTRGAFSAGDIQLFESLVEQITTVIEVDALHAQQVAAEQTNRELEIAAEVQASLLPSELPQLPGFEFAATLVSASKIAGDLYDFVECDNGNTALLVSDVAGKGISAALLAASVRATVRAELQWGTDPGGVLQTANAGLYEDMSRIDRFATAMLVCVPPGSQTLHYASAGHTAALWVEADPLRVHRLPSTTLPLGVLPEIDGTTETVELGLNDVLVMYTDGLTETETEQGHIVGMAGITDVLLATYPAPAQFILDSLIEAHEQYRGDRPVSDDLTLLVIKRQADGGPAAQHLRRLHLPGDLRVLADLETYVEELRPHLPSREPDTWLMKVQLALTEAVANIITHAYAGQAGSIHGLIALYPHRLQIDLFDAGAASYEEREPCPLDFAADDPPAGGYGLHIMRQAMDSVKYQRLPDGHNHWRLSCALPSGL